METDSEAFDNFWYKARRSLIRDLFLKYGSQDKTVLELGCGAGSQLLALRPLCQSLRGCDINEEALAWARKEDLNVFRHDIEKERLGEATEDILCAFDVIEHIKDDVRALRHIYEALKPGGYFFFSVPAFPSLYSGHDKHLQHVRRYGQKELKQKIENSGFEIEELFYWNSLLFLPLALKRLKDKKKIASDINSYRSFNKILFRLLLMENQLWRLGIRFPFGLSIFGVASKKQSIIEEEGQ